MAGSDTERPPLEAVTGAAGPQVVNALKLLSDETRLAVLLALWEASGIDGPTETMSFLELSDRVAIRDTGTFIYHLNELSDHFVEKLTTDTYSGTPASSSFALSPLELDSNNLYPRPLNSTSHVPAMVKPGWRSATGMVPSIYCVQNAEGTLPPNNFPR